MKGVCDQCRNQCDGTQHYYWEQTLNANITIHKHTFTPGRFIVDSATPRLWMLLPWQCHSLHAPAGVSVRRKKCLGVCKCVTEGEVNVPHVCSALPCAVRCSEQENIAGQSQLSLCPMCTWECICMITSYRIIPSGFAILSLWLLGCSNSPLTEDKWSYPSYLREEHLQKQWASQDNLKLESLRCQKSHDMLIKLQSK